MRTTDFSKAPEQAQAAALVVVEVGTAGASRSGVLVGRAASQNRRRPGSPTVFGLNAGGGSWLTVQKPKASDDVSNAAGHIWHKTFWRGAIYGVIVFFDTVEHAEAHRDHATELGYSTRLLIAEPSGYSNGVWRAEANVMAHIERFTPTSVEAARGRTPPLVAAPAVAGRASEADAPQAAAARQRPVTDALAMFVGATKYRGPRALFTLSRTWYAMVAKMQRMPGYVWHTVYWEPPFTLGTLAFFAARDDLLAFARMPAHRHLMQWITDGTKHGTGGYIRLHSAPNDAQAHPLAPGGTTAAPLAPGDTTDAPLAPGDTTATPLVPGDHAAPSPDSAEPLGGAQ